MEFRQLTTFIRAAQFQSFSKAADSLGYSQAAVTVQIRLLEEELGTRLFDRMGKKVSLTDRGRRLLEGAHQVLKDVDAMRRGVDGGEPLDGVLRLGTIESLCYTRLPYILQTFQRLHPGVSVKISTASPEELIERMEHNGVDLIYILDEPRYSNSWNKLMERREEIVFVASARSALVGREALRLEDLLCEPFFLTEKDANYRRVLDRHTASRQLELRPFLEVSNTEFIVKMLEGGTGVSFLPRFAVEDAVRKGSLAVLDVRDCHTVMYRQIFYHKEKWKTREMEEFFRLVLEN